jgi:hypothetical protein
MAVVHKGTARWVQDDIDRLVQLAEKASQPGSRKRDGDGLHPALQIMRLDGTIDVTMFAVENAYEQMRAMVGATPAGVSRERVRAVALVVDLRVRDASGRHLHDAVRIEVEHRSGPALTYMLPYKLKRWGKPEVGRLKVYPRERFVWFEPLPGIWGKRPVAIKPDAVKDDDMYLIKACDELRFTWEIRATIEVARAEGYRVKVVVPQGCRVHPRLEEFQIRHPDRLLVVRAS